MITRIVKLTFCEDNTEDFLEIFRMSRQAIGDFPGLVDLTLLRDHIHQNVFFTISIWDSEQDLEAYRQSALFSDVWAKTKALFSAKAEAWTLDVLQNKSSWQ
ncbi:MAG: antibiotic biosynthesis monooxygenase [Saprospiraceae bacterium]|nr:antibiotic biosynthesis monooxygenase [Saprospiraceae bacterium]